MNQARRSKTPPAAHRSPSAAPPNAGTAREFHAPDPLPTSQTHAPPPETSNPNTGIFPIFHRETSPSAPPAISQSLQTSSPDPAPTRTSDTDPTPTNQSARRCPEPPAAPSPPKQTPAALRATHNKKA